VEIPWHSFLIAEHKTASLHLQLANDAVAFVYLFVILPADGISAANYSKREVRHVLVLWAAFGQVERLASERNL
jgi:hypothetical protein